MVAAVVVAGLLRAPFLFTGLSTDEGGYAYVAQQWARGARLYDAAWLDRPQGLLLTYRFLLWLGSFLGPERSGWPIRFGMVLAGMVITAALAAIGTLLLDARLGLTAAWLYAVVGVAPHLEGMTLNGELLAGAPAVVSIALALRWWRQQSAGWWLAAAGVFAGLALTMKQSGIDGVVVGLLVVALAGTGEAAAGRVRAAAVFLAGAAVAPAACALHGVATGWSRYWTALVGYQLTAAGGPGSNADTRWSAFVHYTPRALWDLAFIALVAVLGWRGLDRFARWVTGAWLLVGLVAVNLGGSYWPHYWVQALPVLVLLAAAAVVAARPVRWRAALGAVVVLPTLAWLVALIPMSGQQRARTIPYAALAQRDDRIAAAVDAASAPTDRIYVLESEAYLYFAAQRTSPYPYLWGKPIDKIPDALPRLRAMLAGPDRPTLVILDTPDPDAVDSTGGVRAALAAHYHLDSTVDGVAILRSNG